MSKYVAIARARLLAALVYDRDLLVRSLLMLVILVTFVQLWSTTFETTGQALVDGFSLRDLVWYLIVTETVALSTPRVVEMIDHEVRAGDVAYSLGKPMHYPLYHLAGYWGETLVRLPVNALVGSTVALIAVGPPAVNPLVVAPTVLSIILAITVKACIEILIGLSAFWVEDTLPMQWIHNKFMLTVGGTLIPLDLFPSWLAAISFVLPFAATMYAPARIFVAFSIESFFALVLLQVIWLVILWVAIEFLFALASRRVVAHGG